MTLHDFYVGMDKLFAPVLGWIVIWLAVFCYIAFIIALLFKLARWMDRKLGGLR